MTPNPSPPADRGEDPLLREAEDALRGLGYPKARSVARRTTAGPSFWVENPRNRRRTIPVYVEPSGTAVELPSIEKWFGGGSVREPASSSSILVVPTDQAAESARGRLTPPTDTTGSANLRILVLRGPRGKERSPHWHLRRVDARQVLRLSTGIVVGMYRRAFSGSGAGEVDFGELLRALADDYGVDVHKSLGVSSDEDALFVLYHLALRDSFAPGNIANNLHSIVANPTGPASRIPWFAG